MLSWEKMHEMTVGPAILKISHVPWRMVKSYTYDLIDLTSILSNFLGLSRIVNPNWLLPYSRLLRGERAGFGLRSEFILIDFNLLQT